MKTQKFSDAPTQLRIWLREDLLLPQLNLIKDGILPVKNI